MKRIDYHRPRSLAEALELRGGIEGARWVAGGTDLLVQIKGGAPAPAALISLRSLPELAGIDLAEGGRIGAGTTLAEILEHEGLRARYPVLVQAVERMACAQIRNTATIGGNLCNASPCADTAPPLLVLGARVRILGPSGERELHIRERELPIEELFTGPGETALAAEEILAEIRLPPPAEGSRAVYRCRGRVGVDLSIASVAVLLELEGETCRRARIAAGAVAPTPLRLPEAEAVLAGSAVTAERAARAGEIASGAVAPISDVRAGLDYRRWITGVLLRRAIAEIMGRSE